MYPPPPQGSEPRQSSQPPSGAVVAEAAYPAVGKKWRIRVSQSTAFASTTGEREVTAAMVDYEGRQAYAIVSPRTTSIMNPANYNTMFITRDGQSARKNTPDNGDFSWPLWVGKAWTSTYFYNDFKLGRVFQISATIKVAAYEDITVPAGTFKAFRLEYTPERNNASSGMYW